MRGKEEKKRGGVSQTDAEIFVVKWKKSKRESEGCFGASLCSRLELDLAPEGNRAVG